MNIKTSLLLAIAGLQLAGLVRPAFADLPVSGRPVPELDYFDDLMNDYMEVNNIWAGVLGIMKDGKIVYLRGFGYSYDGVTPLPENALFRLASCSKPITAAAVRQQVAAGQYSLSKHVFNLGQSGGGLLDATTGGTYEPVPKNVQVDQDLKNLEIQHLISFTAGWDRDSAAGDLTYKELEIAEDMDISSPPGRTNTVRWILGQPNQFTPGTIPPSTVDRYCNISYLLMGLIVEQHSGMDLVSYVRKNVLTPDMWIPSTEIQGGHTFRESDKYGSQDPREPRYDCFTFVKSRFDDVPSNVPWPYGGYDLEARIGQGGFVASAATMLECLQRYHVDVYGADIGQPIDTTYPLNGDEKKGGALKGVSTYMVQRTNGVNVFIAFAEDHDPELCNAPDIDYALDFYDTLLETRLDGFSDSDWPSDSCEGFWVDPGLDKDGGVGGYDDPFQGVDAALNYCKDGSKLRLKEGSSSWTGTIQTRVLMDAPLGTAVIGR